MLDTDQGMTLLGIMEIVGPLVLLAGLAYGTLMWSSRRKSRHDPTVTIAQNVKEGRLPPEALSNPPPDPDPNKSVRDAVIRDVESPDVASTKVLPWPGKPIADNVRKPPG